MQEPFPSPAPDRGESLIEVEGLVKNFVMGEAVVRALQQVSFEIHRGTFAAIMGPSGSGKTTLLDILGCLSRPTSGTYRLAGQRVGDLSEARLAQIRNHEIGFVFQNFNLLARSTALANVELPLLYDGVPRRERIRRATEALVAVGLADRLHHRPSELSGGQRQRVAIARALVNKPSIVFADEPTGNLDSKSGESILALFDEIHKRGNTIIMVTHERDVAVHAQRIMSFRDGQLVKDEWQNEDGMRWESEYSAG
jgi:putative ABC transport system ATP-binding protein